MKGEVVMIKIRIGNYKIALLIHSVLKIIWWKLLGRGISFDQVDGLDYEGKAIDLYYLIQLK